MNNKQKIKFIRKNKDFILYNTVNKKYYIIKNNEIFIKNNKIVLIEKTSYFKSCLIFNLKDILLIKV